MLKKFLCLSVMVCLLALNTFGCKPDNAATSAGTKPAQTAAGNYAEITDDENRKVVLSKKPERVVVMVPSILQLADAVGGTAVGRPSASPGKDVPASMQKATEVGHVFNISMEKVVALNPDLALINEQQYKKFAKMLETNHINAIVLQPKTYGEIKNALITVGSIYGTRNTAETRIKEMDGKIASVINKIPKDHKKKVVILHATPSAVTVEMETSIAGSVAKSLGFVNIASGTSPTGNKSQDKPATTQPFSMEVMVEKNPDIIFITTMGAQDKIESRLQADVKGNPAYAALNAVKNNKVYVLPKDLFLLEPGLRYPEAVELMAKDVFPENFK